ncbi:phenylalanyl-tRNA ligase subunit beta [Moraxella macacae 0408225]|uniref:Phenylalanine--tRNA ligase beta subunit n=1 Tax=Moraxella macacae 0408225 TaxID=1230338 RepID=L2F9L3_9GAMM|nr:phenylalanine--tRNA ligase subunit beta [Moraxella macacae]ELA09732.1 phenylalanyl-tRNA ligase subunit beta [Moraxella macacae 0408225]
MKLNENWLRAWVNPKLTAEQIGEQLTMAGLELDNLTKVARDFCGVVVGEVLSVEQHPDADKLKVTMVNIGQGEPLQIVCGASNVAVGIKIPVATIGAQLPPIEGKAFHIKKNKLRGVLSHGMLCGGSEIDCDDGVDGLLILPVDAPIGMDIREYLNLDNHILDISITPNRGDCFSVRGMARELAVLNNLPFRIPFDTKPVAKNGNEKQAVGVLSDACARYFVQVLTDVVNVESPKFIVDALNGSGIKPKNLLVDVTNFVLMELGQPLHAFDKDKIVGKINVRIANAGEKLLLLNESEITLSGDELVICDDDGVIALAGIMGGLRTAVSDTTKNVVIESAFFKPVAIAGKARRFGLHTDASQRFERGVDFELPEVALNRAVSLLKEFGKANVHDITKHDDVAQLPKRDAILVSLAKIHSLLGVNIDKKICIDILQKLEIKTEESGDILICTPPSHRYDINIAEDLVEEIARIYGYNNIANCLPSFHANLYDNSKQRHRDTIKQALVNAGYFEAVSFSFSDEKIEQHFDNQVFAKPLMLANPISSDLAVMRRTLLSSLLPCIKYNLNRQQNRIRLFEMGLRFDGETVESLSQIDTLALIAVGTQNPEQPFVFDSTVKAGMDFYDLKHDVERVLPACLVSGGRVRYVRSELDFLHPGQGADVLIDTKKIGYLGQLHPRIAQALDLPTVWVAELDINALIELHDQQNAVVAPSKFPSVRRDMAVLVDRSVHVQDLMGDIYTHAGLHLKDVWLFDVYEGERLPTDKKSLAFAMIWQDHDGTLSDELINANFTAIVTSLANKYQAVLRD